jgi:hypothetical protein
LRNVNFKKDIHLKWFFTIWPSSFTYTPKWSSYHTVLNFSITFLFY